MERFQSTRTHKKFCVLCRRPSQMEHRSLQKNHPNLSRQELVVKRKAVLWCFIELRFFKTIFLLMRTLKKIVQGLHKIVQGLNTWTGLFHFMTNSWKSCTNLVIDLCIACINMFLSAIQKRSNIWDRVDLIENLVYLVWKHHDLVF